MSAPTTGSFLCTRAYRKSNLVGISHPEAPVPILQRHIDCSLPLRSPQTRDSAGEGCESLLPFLMEGKESQWSLTAFPSCAFRAGLCLSRVVLPSFPGASAPAIVKTLRCCGRCRDVPLLPESSVRINCPQSGLHPSPRAHRFLSPRQQKSERS